MAPHKIEPPLKKHFSLIKPMEPVSAKEPFSSPGFTFQIKWDGVRLLAFVASGEVRLQNRKGRERTVQYPELQSLKYHLKASEALLDGEAVVLKEGRPSFARVIERDFSSRQARIAHLSRSSPCTYCIFDILYLDGEDLTGLPLVRREEILKLVLSGTEAIYINENFPDGRLLYRRVTEEGMEGIVAKDMNSPYLPGRKSPYWRKIKPRRRMLTVIGGVGFSKGYFSSLLLGAYRDGKLIYLGRAGSGLSSSDCHYLKELVERYRVSKPCFINPPRMKEVCWVEPRITVMVEFMEWTEGLMMRAPVIIGFSSSHPHEAAIE